MLTNFVTIRKAVKKMATVDRMKKDGTFETLSKKEKLQVSRMRAKLEKNLGSITEMTRLPGALFVVDIKREHIAIKEAQKLNIPIFAMVDTNSDPREVDFVIPSNDDASKSIEKILSLVTLSVSEGLSERKNEKESIEKGENQIDSTEETQKPKSITDAKVISEVVTNPVIKVTAEVETTADLVPDSGSKSKGSEIKPKKIKAKAKKESSKEKK